MAEYTIEKISQDEPRQYDGQNGTVYYIKVKLSGHDKAVSIGKKSPDALKVGDKVNGTVTETQYDADKFTADKQAFGGGQSKPSFSQSPEQQENIARSVALKAAVDIAGTSSAHSLGAELLVDAVLQTAETFLAWLTQKPTEEKPTREWDKLGKKEPVLDTVVEKFDESQPIDLSEIPF